MKRHHNCYNTSHKVMLYDDHFEDGSFGLFLWKAVFCGYCYENHLATRGKRGKWVKTWKIESCSFTWQMFIHCDKTQNNFFMWLFDMTWLQKFWVTFFISPLNNADGNGLFSFLGEVHVIGEMSYQFCSHVFS